MSGSRRMLYPRVKRVMDVVVAAVGLVVAAPILGGVAIAVRRDLGPPVLFRQSRPGRHGRAFRIVKFRTMRPATSTNGIGNDEERLTTTGKWLRCTSLDELPSLWNVLRGDMSLVGPRPLLMEYLDRYTAEQARRHDVRPGMTGLAQVRGRNALTWEDKFSADVEYVDRLNFRLDVCILLATVRSVLRREGISAEGDATMPLFLGARGAESGLRSTGMQGAPSRPEPNTDRRPRP